MLRKLNTDVLIGLLMASLFWVAVFVWQSSQPPNHTSAASQHCEGTKSECAKATTDERIADYTWWLAVLTAGLVISGLIQFGFLIRSDNTARIAANAAVDAANLAAKHERAYFFSGPVEQSGIEIDIEAGFMRVQMEVENSGRTLGILKKLCVAFTSEVPQGNVVQYEGDAFKTFEYDTVVRAGAKRPFTGRLESPFPVMKVFLIGYIEYVDIFKASHLSRFCIEVDPDGQYGPAGDPTWNDWD
jgi:hypothetical protein